MAAPGWLTRSLADVPDARRLAERPRAGGTRRPAYAQAPGRLAAGALGGEGGARGAARASLPRGGVVAARGRRAGGVARRRAPPVRSRSAIAPGGRSRSSPRARGRWLRSRGDRARSGAFLREWLPRRARAGGRTVRPAPAVAANLVWTAKEAAAKARREGLRLDVRRATVEPEGLAGSPGSGCRCASPGRRAMPTSAGGGRTRNG